MKKYIKAETGLEIVYKNTGITLDYPVTEFKIALGKREIVTNCFDWTIEAEYPYVDHLDSLIPLPLLFDKEYINNFLFGRAEIRVASTVSKNALSPLVAGENQDEVEDDILDERVIESLNEYDIYVDDCILKANPDSHESKILYKSHLGEIFTQGLNLESEEE